MVGRVCVPRCPLRGLPLEGNNGRVLNRVNEASCFSLMITFRQRDLEGAGYVGWLLDEGIGLLGFIFTALSYVNNLPEVGGLQKLHPT